MRRSFSVAALLAALFVALTAIPAFADPPLVIVDPTNGHVTKRVVHPTNDNWYVDLAVATDIGFTENEPTASATHVSGVARISRGPGALRAQVETIRVGIHARVVDDHRPSADAFDNPPPGEDGRNNGLTPIDWLNSDGDYPGNVITVRGFSDWHPLVLPTPTASGDCGVVDRDDTTVATRGFFAVRWSNGDYSRLTLRSGNAPLPC